MSNFLKKSALKKLLTFTCLPVGTDFQLLTGARASRERGFGIIEIIIAITIMSLALFSISQISVLTIKKNTENKESLKALYLAEEGLEAARSARDQSWSLNIAAKTMGSPYYPVISGDKWTLSASNPGAIEGIYSRQTVISNTSRDVNDNIVSSGGTDDPNTKKITATISWGSKDITLETYITNIYNN